MVSRRVSAVSRRVPHVSHTCPGVSRRCPGVSHTCPTRVPHALPTKTPETSTFRVAPLPARFRGGAAPPQVSPGTAPCVSRVAHDTSDPHKPHQPTRPDTSRVPVTRIPDTARHVLRRCRCNMHGNVRWARASTSLVRAQARATACLGRHGDARRPRWLILPRRPLHLQRLRPRRRRGSRRGCSAASHPNALGTRATSLASG